MANRYLAIILFVFIYANLSAQPASQTKGRYKVYGKVVSNTTKSNDTVTASIPYATVRLLDGKRTVAGVAATDPKGNFSISVKYSGKYLVRFEALGYNSDSLTIDINETVQDIGVIRLSEGQQLSGVTVSAKKLIMRDELDRLVYDVTQDPEAKRVKMMDIMKKIPFMTENAKDGKLQYLNDKIFTIMIDGKPNEMINGGRQFPMRLIKGDVMSKIEIILPGTKDNPGEKPILNIKLSRELPDGYAAEVMAEGDNQKKAGGDIDLVTKFNKLYLSIKYGMDYQDKPKLESYTDKENMNEEALVPLQKSSSRSWGDNTSHNLALGASYQITKKDNIRFSLSTNSSSNNSYINTSSNNYSAQNELIGYKTSNSVNKGKVTPMVNGSFSYRHALDGNNYIRFSYNLTNNRNISDYTLITNKSDLSQPDYQISERDNSTVDQSAELRLYQKKGTKHLFEASCIYTNRKYSNSSDFEYWNYDTQNLETYTLRQEGLDYTQEVYRGYGKYNYLVKNFSIILSLAFEQMVNNGVFHNTEDSKLDYNEFNYFPSVGIVYRTKHKYKIGVSYKTRTLRPDINYLNPFVDNSDPENITMGNPDLRAEYAHCINFNITKSIGNGIVASFQSGAEFTNNAIESVTSIDARNISTTTYHNIGKKEDYQASFDLSFKPFRNVILLNMVRFNYKRYSSTNLGVNKVKGFGYFGCIEASITKSTQFLGSFSITPQMNYAQTQKVKYLNSFSFYLSQTLIKNKLFLTLNLDDPFRSHKYVQNIIGNDLFKMTTRREQMGRVLGFRLRWDFGRLKDRPQSSNSANAPSDLVRPDLLSK